MVEVIPCSNRRCTHVDQNGVRCITRLCFANPGPDCFAHQSEFTPPAHDLEGPSARELLGRLMAAQPTPVGERRAA